MIDRVFSVETRHFVGVATIESRRPVFMTSRGSILFVPSNFSSNVTVCFASQAVVQILSLKR
jgi:hypothetical protein